MDTPREIDLDTWPRRPHFEHFRHYLIPHSALTVQADVTGARIHAREGQRSLFRVLLWVACRAANAVPELRQRIREAEDGAGASGNLRVVEHAAVHPSYTAAGPNRTFSYCRAPYRPDLADFLDACAEAEGRIAGAASVTEAEGDDRLFITSAPWVSFTQVQHPQQTPADSVPRIAWGRVTEVHGRARMPLSLQAHHGLVDGIHMADFFDRFEAIAAGLAE